MDIDQTKVAEVVPEIKKDCEHKEVKVEEQK